MVFLRILRFSFLHKLTISKFEWIGPTWKPAWANAASSLNFVSMYVSWKPPTYRYPKLTFCPKQYVSTQKHSLIRIVHPQCLIRLFYFAFLSDIPLRYLSVCTFLFRRSTLKFVVLDYDKFSRSEFVAEVMLSLLDVDITEGTTLSLHLNSKTISDVSRVCTQ